MIDHDESLDLALRRELDRLVELAPPPATTPQADLARGRERRNRLRLRAANGVLAAVVAVLIMIVIVATLLPRIGVRHDQGVPVSPARPPTSQASAARHAEIEAESRRLDRVLYPKVRSAVYAHLDPKHLRMVDDDKAFTSWDDNPEFEQLAGVGGQFAWYNPEVAGVGQIEIDISRDLTNTFAATSCSKSEPAEERATCHRIGAKGVAGARRVTLIRLSPVDGGFGVEVETTDGQLVTVLADDGYDVDPDEFFPFTVEDLIPLAADPRLRM